MSSPATEMSQGKRKVAEDDDELSDARLLVVPEIPMRAKKRRSCTNTDDNTSADTCADDDALPTSRSSRNPLPPHIPAPVWGHVLDYMPYGEVRSALLVGKIIANEAVKYVQTINIMNSWEMDVPAARRFANVTEVNILSLLRFQRFLARAYPRDFEDVGEDEYDFQLCETTAERIIPFIVGFQRLQRFRAGGLDDDKDFQSYDDAMYMNLIEADDSEEVLRALVTHFVGAFSTRSLPTTLESIPSITSALVYIRPCTRRDDHRTPCKYCRKVLKYFPIKDLIKPYESDVTVTCFSILGNLNMLADRQGFKERCSELSEKYLVGFIKDSLIRLRIKDGDLCERLQESGVTARKKNVMYLDSDDMAKIDRLIALGFDPKSVSHHKLHDELMIGVYMYGRMYDVYDKSTFKFLVSRGFPLAEADLLLLDKTKEPALKELREERN